MNVVIPFLAVQGSIAVIVEVLETFLHPLSVVLVLFVGTANGKLISAYDVVVVKVAKGEPLVALSVEDKRLLDGGHGLLKERFGVLCGKIHALLLNESALVNPAGPLGSVEPVVSVRVEVSYRQVDFFNGNLFAAVDKHELLDLR